MDFNKMTLDYVLKNKDLLLQKKMVSFKRADGLASANVFTEVGNSIAKMDFDFTIKAENQNTNISIADASEIKAKLVINTCGLIDSHMDCHIKGLWKQTLNSGQSRLLHLQEHELEFEKIISTAKNDGLTALTQTVSWKKLGFTYEGSTEALIFDTNIKKSVNEFMFGLYANGRVDEHSVGMKYVKIYLCVNTKEPDYTVEKDNWDKYYSMVVNKEVADEKGFFWAVTEAKLIEGSAVPLGSNFATPTMEIEIEKEDIEAADKGTSQNEPPKGTQRKKNTSILYY